MRIISGTLLSLTLLLGACSPNKPSTNSVAYQMAKLSSQAKTLCIQGGGVPGEALSLQGVAVAVCQLPNGKRCAEGELLAGSCLRGKP